MSEQYSFKEYVFPTCPKCRAMRLAICAAILLVVGAYAFILLDMYREKQEQPE